MGFTWLGGWMHWLAGMVTVTNVSVVLVGSFPGECRLDLFTEWDNIGTIKWGAKIKCGPMFRHTHL